jgi:hypothetical protein
LRAATLKREKIMLAILGEAEDGDFGISRSYAANVNGHGSRSDLQNSIKTTPSDFATAPFAAMLVYWRRCADTFQPTRPPGRRSRPRANLSPQVWFRMEIGWEPKMKVVRKSATFRVCICCGSDRHSENRALPFCSSLDDAVPLRTISRS